MQNILTKIDTFVGRRKLIAVFGFIILIAVIFLYYENIYNLNYHFKFLSQSKGIDSNNSNKLSGLDKDNKDEKIANSDMKEKQVLFDNKNNRNSTKCWNVESYKIIEPCFKCDSYSMNFLNACAETGYRESLNCQKYGVVSRSCPVPEHVIVKRYWSFELICLTLTTLFTSFVLSRKKYLDNQATERVRQQLLSG